VRPFERRRAHGTAAPAAAGATVGTISGRTVLLSLLAFFGVVIGANVVMATLAITTMPGTEVESPYLTGVKYNSEIIAAREQVGRGWRMASQVDRDADGRAIVRVEAQDRDGAPLSGLAVTVRLARPADKRADRIVALTERGGGSYIGETADVGAGIWGLEFDADRNGQRMFRSKNRVTLH
jgi:nitrogen fixation protein FixH